MRVLKVRIVNLKPYHQIKTKQKKNLKVKMHYFLKSMTTIEFNSKLATI